jgi:hypothetical protein
VAAWGRRVVAADFDLRSSYPYAANSAAVLIARASA